MPHRGLSLPEAVELSVRFALVRNYFSMRTTSRVDYDVIAQLYDGQPHRRKTVDPELVTFIAQHASPDRLSLLDIACGTGSQLVANRPIVRDARLVGLDRSFGMLAQARSKVTNIAGVRADGAKLPFRAESFDFICCQFGFHHLADKAGMLGQAFKVLRPGGRFVMRNLCPHEHPDWLYYEYFPEAQTIDLEDFWPPDTIVSTMQAIGFVAISAVPEHIRFEQDLRVWLDMVRRRDLNSQVLAISDRAYEEGIARLERQLANGGAAQVRNDHICLLTIRGDK
jgi:ubiquinone/menaquinone biosynthesis C-methylase UbiE